MNRLNKLPPGPGSESALEENLSVPSEEAIRAMGRLSGDLILLGVGGKMGPSLARMAKWASQAASIDRRVIGVSRFSDPAIREGLEANGVETIAGDLLDENFVSSLPEVANVVHMAGFKFGTIADPSMTWGMNCYLPSLVSRKYRNSRIAAFSTGNIYGMVANLNDGSVESDVPRPVGEYAMAALGRERVFQYFSRALRVPMVLLRLNYATELRYGVLVDLAQKIWTGQPIDLSMGYVNVIWQTDANAMALTALEHAASPPFVVNIAGEPILSIRQVAANLGELLNRRVHLVGEEAPDALVSNGRRGHRLLGKPKTDSAAMIRWTADWIRGGGRILDKPTHFEDRAGNF